MIRVNDNFRELPSVYLFTRISRRLNEYKANKENIPLIRMDIGDIPGPVPSTAIEAMTKAVYDLAGQKNFYGYGPEQGYSFLREAISQNDYNERNVDISPAEIFISDGAKCDLGNLGDIISRDCKIAVMNPSYPAYIDDNAIDGRAGKLIDGIYPEVRYLKCCPGNNYFPELPNDHVDVIYICSPNNPTGVVLTKEHLKTFVEYASKEGALLIFDSAYEAYIRNPNLPKSIYEIEGAREVAIEVRSFSKTGGFTGIRCGYTVVPNNLYGTYANGEQVQLNRLWSRRQTTKFNGASYIAQRGAEALYTPEGKCQVRAMTDVYLQNASMLRALFEKSGWKVAGGNDSPYVWAGAPCEINSEDIFERLLLQCGVSTTPGSGFGTQGNGYIRLSGFNSPEATLEAISRLENTVMSFKTS